MPETLDLDLLRTFALVQETGTLARAARRVGRTLSAVSLQLKRLESQCGRPLLRRSGRRLVLNPDGERVLAEGRRMLALNDRLLESLREDAPGILRLGLPQDVAERLLPQALARFARARPRVQLEVRVERNLTLREMLAGGALDLAITFDPEAGGPEQVHLPVRWLASPELRWERGAALPLVLFEPPCTFRRLALEGLDRAGLPWRVVFSSPSLSGLWAAVSAGLGVTVRTELAIPPRVSRVRDRRLPPLPALAFRVEGGAGVTSGPVAELRALLLDTLRQAAAASVRPHGRARQPSAAR